LSNQPSPSPGDHLDTTVYSIPAALFHAFPGRPAILRITDPAQPRALFGPVVPEALTCVQLTGLNGDMTPLADWGEGLSLDLMMVNPAAELPMLYRCTRLLDRHPVRITIPFLPGLAGAVKLAVSLGFEVLLKGRQPTPEVVAEARQALEGYLHNPTVAQPVEPFHSILLAFLHDTPIALWSLLEQDPSELHIVGDQGQLISAEGPTSVRVFRDALVAAGAECRGCAWLSICGGYFKWPWHDYACTDVKPLFCDIQAAAFELRQGLADYDAGRG
jgi:hypothetical protein